MVSSLPLPPKQPTLDTGVLTSDTPSPAPVITKEKTEPPPKPDELAIPDLEIDPLDRVDAAVGDLELP